MMRAGYILDTLRRTLFPELKGPKRDSSVELDSPEWEDDASVILQTWRGWKAARGQQRLAHECHENERKDFCDNISEMHFWGVLGCKQEGNHARSATGIENEVKASLGLMTKLHQAT